MSLTRLIFQFVALHWRSYAAAGLMLASIAVLTVLVPRQVGQIIDGLVAGQMSSATLLRETGKLAAMGVAIYLFRVGWRLTLFAAAFQFGQMLRTRLYARLVQQGPAFYQTQSTGDLMALATNDIDAIEMTAGEAMLAGFDGSLTFILVLGMMTLGVDWRLALAALLPFPFMALAFWHISARIHHASQASLRCFAELNSFTQESVTGVRMLRALGLEARNARQFSILAGRAADASHDAQRWEAAYEPAVGLSLSTAAVITLALGSLLVWQGELTIGALTSFSMYLGTLIWPMFAAGWVLALIERGRAAWDRLAPVLDQPLSMLDHGGVTHFQAGELRLDKVSFHYPAQNSLQNSSQNSPKNPSQSPSQNLSQGAALSEISFSLPAGQTLGLVGPTGSGKTSLIRLLLRQFAPDRGSLHVGQIDLHDFALATLRDALSWVPQESFLFSASIADNIALARPNATRAEIEHVAVLAAVHADILRFPQGYDTAVGERGMTLSGGQRQRLAIARALLAERPILLMDDALSAVDTGTEASILQHLASERHGRTVIIASHRLSSVADADLIIVLQQGRIIERGSHVALLALDGWYASQWRYQQLEESLHAA